MLNPILYVALPYISVLLFVGVSIRRYRKDPFTFSSLSSQFLETKGLFWGSVPFHLGILALFFGHLFGFMFPRQMVLFGHVPTRLLILETSGMIAALLTLTGLVGLMLRRVGSARLQANTSRTDLLVYAALTFQIVTGLWVALALRWGSAWYPQTLVPYLRSLATFQPDIQRVVELPLPARLHVIGAFVLFGLFSFTRLVHALVAPVPYLWRPNQLVIWNRARGAR